MTRLDRWFVGFALGLWPFSAVVVLSGVIHVCGCRPAGEQLAPPVRMEPTTQPTRAEPPVVWIEADEFRPLTDEEFARLQEELRRQSKREIVPVE